MFAVKVIQLKLLKKHNMMEACHHEIDINKGLKHRHIVRYWGDFSTKKETSIVMELAAGGSLAEYIGSSEGGVPGERAEEIALQMASGLSYMHDQGVYHRDMKPENVLLSSKGAVKIADFGLSKSVGTGGLSAMGTAVGTPNYHSPQKVRYGQQYSGAKDDMWGMGCILTELASSMKLTMPLWDDGDVIQREREERVARAKLCSVLVGHVVMGCLQLDEGARISAAQAVVAIKGGLVASPKAVDNMSGLGAAIGAVRVSDKEKEDDVDLPPPPPPPMADRSSSAQEGASKRGHMEVPSGASVPPDELLKGIVDPLAKAKSKGLVELHLEKTEVRCSV
eukprot:CAMPEP_0173447476 /NCGR_PEP_ID=MMETSP1357-20121228/38746_1 /TAXON_ID=77926 /ORGANISM="Hemiselmis rufescens, Strain PCC563" /LENGTH=336 /DNA_ID=CAMNT_0014413865 /DNA_START=261 /DNA_END=1271 /DNA_ORIENTATION=-